MREAVDPAGRPPRGTKPRRIQSTILGIAIALFATAACVTRSASDEVASPSGLDPQSAADRELLAFAEANPQCQLWTDWQRICSRTGPDGVPLCATDPDRPVQPSTPFCVYANGGTLTADTEGPAARSVGRFCADETSYRTNAGRPGEEGREVRACRAFQNDRPFNGRNLAARRHPWCAEWSDTYTERAVCSEDGADSELQSCSTLAQAGYQHARPLYCSRLNTPAWCGRAEGLLDRVNAEPGILATRDVRYQTSDFLPAHGVVCGERNDGQ